MSDRSMPDYNNEPNEWESNRTVEVPRHIAVQMKSFANRVQLAQTLQALLSIRHDIERGALANNAPAKEQLRRTLNQRAQEVGFKAANGERWWN